MINPKKYDPDWIFHTLLESCVSEDERTYASDHRFRFSMMINNLIPYLKPGMKVANIGLSILDPLMLKILKLYSVDYQVIVPNDHYTELLTNGCFNKIPKSIFDITAPKHEYSANLKKFDIVMFYEVMEHILAPDDLIFLNISRLIKNDGFLLGSFPNAAKLESRLSILLGRNIFWTKDKIINGVFGGYGHLREYTFSEISSLISQNFSIRRIYGYSPYGSTQARRFLNLLPKYLRAVIFVEAVKKNSDVELAGKNT